SLFFHQAVKAIPIDSQAALTSHELGKIERKSLFVIQPESESARDAGERTRLACLVWRLAGRPLRPGFVLARPEPRIVLTGGRHHRRPGILANVNELLLQIALRTDESIERFLFPNRSGLAPACVESVRRDRFDVLEQFTNRIKNGVASGVVSFDLRL